MWSEQFLKLFKICNCASYNTVLFIVSFFFFTQFHLPPSSKKIFPFIYFHCLFWIFFILTDKQQKIKKRKCWYSSKTYVKILSKFYETLPWWKHLGIWYTPPLTESTLKKFFWYYKLPYIGLNVPWKCFYNQNNLRYLIKGNINLKIFCSF